MENLEEFKIVLPVDENGLVHLSAKEVLLIADAAADKAVDKFSQKIYEEVGKSAVKWFTYTVGAVILGLFMWLANKGDLPK